MTTRLPRFAVPGAAAAMLVALSLATAPAQEPQAATAVDEAAPKITLKWTTASEVDNYGYFVYRGDTVDGPFRQLNEKAIPGAGNADTPSHYAWDDREVEPGRTYYYYLESISVQGVREKFSPVLSKRCCRKPGATPAPKLP